MSPSSKPEQNVASAGHPLIGGIPVPVSTVCVVELVVVSLVAPVVRPGSVVPDEVSDSLVEVVAVDSVEVAAGTDPVLITAGSDVPSVVPLAVAVVAGETVVDGEVGFGVEVVVSAGGTAVVAVVPGAVVAAPGAAVVELAAGADGTVVVSVGCSIVALEPGATTMGAAPLSDWPQPVPTTAVASSRPL